MNSSSDCSISQPEQNRSPRPAGRTRSSRALHPLEKITLAQIGGLILLATWYFAGGSALSQLLIASWGSLSLPITIAAVSLQSAPNHYSRRPLRWLWPVAAFNVLVLTSCLNPSFSEKIF